MTRWLVTGSSGHLGAALVTVLRERGDDVVGLDLLPSTTTTRLASITNERAGAAACEGVDVKHRVS